MSSFSCLLTVNYGLLPGRRTSEREIDKPATPGRTECTCGTLSISDGLCLRLLDPEDGPELHALIESNRSHLARWLPWAAGQTPADTEDFIARCRDQLLGDDGFQTAVVRDGSIVGVAGFVAVDWVRRSAAIGYWLAADRQGQGTMTAAVRWLTDHALATWELDRVEIRVATENCRSRAIPERLGFHQEAVMRGAQLIDDRHLDLVVYTLQAADRPNPGS
jgi:ribosomal-protein-serine acetyltransferase